MISYSKIKKSRPKQEGNMLLFVDLARQAGMPLSQTPIKGLKARTRKLHWNGKDCAYKGDSISNALHELAHWTIAPPKRRKIPNFGLGPSPSEKFEAREYSLDNRVGLQTRENEEMLASVLGIVYEYHLGLDATCTMEEHGWFINDSEEKFNLRIRKLVERGFITKDGKPQWNN